MGSRLRYMRNLRKMSISEMSGKTGISKGAISLAEQGKTSMRCDNLGKICRALNVSADFAIMGKTMPADAEWAETAGTEQGLSLRQVVLRLHNSKKLPQIYHYLDALTSDQVDIVVDFLQALSENWGRKSDE